MNYPAFLAAIRDAPEDDLPRLVCADWFEDDGQSDRAEFVRVQIQLARGVTPRENELALLVRLRDLIRRHRTTWLGALAAYAPEAVFDRGFVESARLDGAALQMHGAAVFDDHPIHRLSLHSVQATKWAKLIALPCLACLTTLELRDNPSGDAPAALGESPHVGKLRALDARAVGLTDAGVARLMAGGLAGLERLNLAGNQFGAAGARALVAGPRPALRELDLASTGMTDAGARALAASPHLAGLQSLRLSYNRVGEAGARAVLSSPHLTGLRSVEVHGAELDTPARERLRREFKGRVVC